MKVVFSQPVRVQTFCECCAQTDQIVAFVRGGREAQLSGRGPQFKPENLGFDPPAGRGRGRGRFSVPASQLLCRRVCFWIPLVLNAQSIA